jgi:hypothetical protein
MSGTETNKLTSTLKRVHWGIVVPGGTGIDKLGKVLSGWRDKRLA